MISTRFLLKILKNTRLIHTKSVKSLLDSEESFNNGNLVRVIGWIKSIRDQKEIKFINLNDGSDLRSLQLVFVMKNLEEKKQKIEHVFGKLNLHTSIEVRGHLLKSENKKQNVELQVKDIDLICECDPTDYPFKAKAKYNLEQLRQHINLRTHNDLFANILRFRSDLTFSFHIFFQMNSFIQIHTPILTTNNCEGGCETFQVNTNNNKVISSQNFFSNLVYLTASAQLHLEVMTSQLAKVYTLSPTFRAEKSMTRHHLAEFYMLEVELIDMNSLDQLLDLTETMVKHVITHVYKSFDVNSFLKVLNKTEHDQLKTNKKNLTAINYSEFILNICNSKFIRITYQQAVDLLNQIKPKSIEYGQDFSKEQEKLLVNHFKLIPVFVTNYPKSLKPFYMRENLENSNLVDNFDLLAPYVGEIVGGSLREHRYEHLVQAMKRQNLNLANYKPYLETKKYGSMKMGGFGLGLERFIQFLLNIENIKDVCAFPRSIYSCKL